jgi:ComEC/Rec2-related protein
LATALVAGIIGDPVVFGSALLLLLGLVWRAHVSPREALILLLLACLLYTYGLRSMARAHHHISHFDSLSAQSEEPLRIQGWVASYPQASYGGVRFEFETAFDGMNHRILLRTPEFWIAYGDSLVTFVEFRSRSRGSGNTQYLLGRGVCGRARALPGKTVRIPGKAGVWLKRQILWPVHDHVRRDTVRGIGSRAGIPLALLLGERGLLDRSAREAFVKLGISHLLALSGLHLGFVAALLILLMRVFFVKRGSVILVMLCVYVALVGFIMSLYRALLMAALLILARAVHRPIRAMSALAKAFFLMLLLYPHALFSVAFQLSFLATLAVLLFAARLQRLPSGGLACKTWHWIRSTVEVSVAVQIVLAPVLLTYFGRVSLASPLATAVFVAPVMIVLLLSAFAVAAGWLLPLAGAPFDHLLYRVTGVFDALLSVSAQMAPSALVLPAPNIYLYYIGLAMIWYSRNRLWIKSAGIIAFGGAWVIGPIDF